MTEELNWQTNLRFVSNAKPPNLKRDSSDRYFSSSSKSFPTSTNTPFTPPGRSAPPSTALRRTTSPSRAFSISPTNPRLPYGTVPLKVLRKKYCNVLGNDWNELSRLWNAYFKIPQRIVDQADSVPGLDTAIGLHYRGTDKLTNTTDSNPITAETFLTLTLDFLASRPETQRIFAATDDFSFVEKLRKAVQLPVINLGEVGFHKQTGPQVDPIQKADRALLDCLLLSRCKSVLQTSSALSSFAKILNPNLEIYRCASSKLFAEIPYFPVAYVPQLSLPNPEAHRILEASMADDWTGVPAVSQYLQPFAYKARYPLRSQLWSVLDTLKGQ